MSSNRKDEQFGNERGQQSRRFGLGPSGTCVCPSCGHKIPHKRDSPCTQIECPKCGSRMYRE